MSEAEYEAERSTIGDLSSLDAPSVRFRLAAGAGVRGSDVLALLEAIRKETTDEPFWSGVRRMAAGDSHVDVQLFEPLAPRLRPLGNAQVECHLYDEESLQKAERRRAERL